MDLELAIENAEFKLVDAEKYIAANDPLAQQGFAYVAVCKEHRKLASLYLLQNADSVAFRKHLSLSAHLWFDFLKNVVPSQKCDPEVLCGSRFLPLLDALAIGEYDLAADIAQLFPHSHQSDWEYEDDYQFYKFVSQFLLSRLNRIPAVDFEALFERWEEVLEGGSDNFLDLSRNLVDVDVQGFIASLQMIIDEREAKFDAWRETPNYQEEVEDANRYVYVNGVGIARLAKLVNIQLSQAMLTIPDLALKA